MSLDWFFVLCIFLAIASAVLCRFLIPCFGRFWIAMAILMPIGIFCLIFYIGAEWVNRYATCNPPGDCGPSKFMAVIYVAGHAAFAGIAGAFAGIIWLLFTRRQRR